MWMRRIVCVWLLFSSLAFSGVVRAQLSESGVEEFLVQLENAAHQRDVTRIIDGLTDDAAIVFRMSALGDIPDLRFNKTQYRDYLLSAFASIEAHATRRFGTKITILKDGQQAEVFANVEETTTMQGKTSIYVSQQTVLIVLEHGRPRVRNVFAEVINSASDT
jgi:hypothetical protein